MKLGITRWKVVPSYNGRPCFLAWETGLVQSFVPSARPMKFATPSGALSGKSLQVILPAVVSMMALGPAEVAPGFAGAALFAGAACVRASSDDRKISKRISVNLRIDAPWPHCMWQDRPFVRAQ